MLNTNNNHIPSFCETIDTDRLIGWDYKKYEECCMKVWHNKGQSFRKRNLPEIQEFLSLYFERKVTVYGIIENENAFNGYPYWTIYFRYDEEATSSK